MRMNSSLVYLTTKSCERFLGFGKLKMGRGGYERNYELDLLIQGDGIVQFIKLEWFSHVRWIWHFAKSNVFLTFLVKETSKRIVNWNPMGRRIRGRPRIKLVDGTEDDLRCMDVRHWRRLCGERMVWRKSIEQAKTHSWLWSQKKKRTSV